MKALTIEPSIAQAPGFKQWIEMEQAAWETSFSGVRVLLVLLAVAEVLMNLILGVVGLIQGNFPDTFGQHSILWRFNVDQWWVPWAVHGLDGVLFAAVLTYTLAFARSIRIPSEIQLLGAPGSLAVSIMAAIRWITLRSVLLFFALPLLLGYVGILSVAILTWSNSPLSFYAVYDCFAIIVASCLGVEVVVFSAAYFRRNRLAFLVPVLITGMFSLGGWFCFERDTWTLRDGPLLVYNYDERTESFEAGWNGYVVQLTELGLGIIVSGLLFMASSAKAKRSVVGAETADSVNG